MSHADTQGAERRVHERYDVIAQVEVNASDDVFFLALQNISLGGALLQITDGDAQFSAGDELSAFVDLSEDAGDNLAINLEAEVIRATAKGGTNAIAVRWVGDNAFTKTQLRRLIDFVAERAA